MNHPDTEKIQSEHNPNGKKISLAKKGIYIAGTGRR